jgi:hypothetical protein
MSKKLILICLSLFSISILTGQSVDELDLRHGFKDIKLGNTESELSDKIIFEENVKNTMKVYRIKNVDSYDVFGKSLKEIKLVFDNGKLVVIRLLTTYYQKPTQDGSENINLEEFSQELTGFKRLFGKGEFIEDSNDSIFKWYWQGKTTVLYLDYYNIMRGGSWLQIIVGDSGLYDKSIKNGF